MTRILALHENLDDIAADVSKKIGRPVFVCAGITQGGTHFRLPGEPESDYRYISRLWRFLSDYTSKHVKRVDHVNIVIGDVAHRDAFYSDLEPSPHRVLAIPLLKDEHLLDPKILPPQVTFGHQEQFKCTAENGEVIEHGLAPYLHEYRAMTWRLKTFGLRFAVTGAFYLPEETRATWHVRKYVPNTSYGGKAIPKTDYMAVMPPGQYPKEVQSQPHSELDTCGRFVVCERDPGACVVCRGDKAERRHFGIVSNMYVQSLVCAACFGDFANDVSATLRSEW